MPTRLCLERNCRNPVRPGSNRCDTHARGYERQRSTRRPEHRKVYKTKLWAMRRKAVMDQAGWICQDGRVCGGEAIAEEVDHLIPLGMDGAPYDMDNLRATCRNCHFAKTAEENAG